VYYRRDPCLICWYPLFRIIDKQNKLYGLYRGRHNMPRPLQVVTWKATQSFQLGGHCACRWCGSSYFIRIASLKFVGLPVPQIWLPFGRFSAFFVSALIGLESSTFDLSTSEWGHPCHWLASFLSICSLLRPSIFDLGSGMGQTDRWTDRHAEDRRRPSTLRGRGLINAVGWAGRQVRGQNMSKWT